MIELATLTWVLTMTYADAHTAQGTFMNYAECDDQGAEWAWVYGDKFDLNGNPRPDSDRMVDFTCAPQ